MCYELWTKARDPCQRRWAPIRQPGTLARLARGLTWLNDRGFHRNSVTFKGKVDGRSGDSIALPSGQGSHSSPPRATTAREGPHPVKSYPTDHIRNVLVVGHGGAGKTSLVEALLYATGAINRVGRVEDGTTVTDFEPEENRKHISASLAVAPVEHDGYKVNLLDAPGYADFIGDVRTALPAADAVLFVVSAPPSSGRWSRSRPRSARAARRCTCRWARSTSCTAWSGCCPTGPSSTTRTAAARRARSPRSRRSRPRTFAPSSSRRSSRSPRTRS